jgi:predicted transglutaminase-like cysteine proteinase
MFNADVEVIKTTLDRIHRQVLARFIEKRDRAENWQMPPDTYDGSQVVKDDCDGFCLAVRTLLRKANIPSRLVYCEIAGSGHLVVEVNGWVLDNRQTIVVANTLLKVLGYKFLRISGFMPGDPWHIINN